MHKIVIALSAVAGLAIGGSIPQLANAAPFGNPSGIAAAQEDIGALNNVHCAPGWRHHYPTSWRRADGCRRYGGVYIGPRWGYRSWGWHGGHRFHHYRYHRGGRRR